MIWHSRCFFPVQQALYFNASDEVREKLDERTEWHSRPNIEEP
jgi:hypothetical protein